MARKTRLERIVKRIGEELALEGAAEVARGFLIERLKTLNADELYEAIQSGSHSLGVSNERDRRFGKKLARRFRKILRAHGESAPKLFTPELYLEWLREDRPDLASLIVNMGKPAKKWLEDDVAQVREFLWPPP